MKRAEDDLAARRPVWSAISNLYLDTSYRASVRSASRELAASPYSLDELRGILMREVHPVLVWNLCATAGVWDRFDQAWLAERILVAERRSRWWPRRFACGRHHAAHLWRLLESRIRNARDASPGNATADLSSRTER